MTAHSEKLKSPDADLEVHFDGGSPEGPKGTRARTATAVWADIDAILNSTSSKTGDLRKLVDELEDAERSKFAQQKLTPAAKVAPGDLVLELALDTNAAPTAVIRAVLASDAKKKPSASVLRAYANQLSSIALAAIKGDEFKSMRDVLDGDIFDEIPAIATRVASLVENADFIGWLVTSKNNKTVAAMLLAEHGSAELAATLDGLKQWEWITHVPHPHGHRGLGELARNTTGDAKDKLKALVGPIGEKSADTNKYREEHAADVETALTGKAKASKVIEAATEQLLVSPEQASRIAELLRKEGVTADELLQFVLEVDIGPTAIELMLAADGVTAAHLKAVLAKQPGSIAGLKNAGAVAKLRGKLGKAIQLDELVHRDPAAHRFVVENEALRDWYLDGATPEELLWFCAGSDEAITAGCRAVARDKGFDWVRKLPVHRTDATQLRRLALGCNHPATVKFIREHLIRDHVDFHGEPITMPVAPDPDTHAGEGGRLVDALDHGSADLVARLADLDEAKRVKLARDDTTVRSFGNAAQPQQWAQIAHLLDLTFRTTIVGCPGPTPATIAYLRTRPPAEETAALADTAVIERAATNIDPDLLLVFPALQEPHQLATILGRMPKLLDLLLAGSEPNKLMTLLSNDEVNAKAAKRLEKHTKLLEHLPDRKHMTKPGRAGIEKLGQAVSEDSDASDRLSQHENGDSIGNAQARAEGKRFADANKKSLPEALDALVASSASQTTVLGVLEQHRKEVPALLAEKGHFEHVRTLFRHISLAPHVVFPYLGIDELFTLANARWWMFAAQPHFLVLDLVAEHPVARGKIAVALNAGDGAAYAWLTHLPPAAELTTRELHTLDLIQPSLTTVDALAALFQARFGVPSTGSDLKQLRSLYGIVSRLPRSHLQQQRIREISSVPARDDNDGGWDSADRNQDGEPDNMLKIRQSLHEGDKEDEFHPGEERYTADEIKRIYGYDDATLKAQVNANRVVMTIENGTPMYYMKTQAPDRLTTVVLHEIGHSIDNILGNRTEPVYGFAKWHTYLDGEFEQWAAEMGGWDNVSAKDRAAIHEAWRHSFNARDTVKNLVDPEHPARAAKYKGVGIVDLANNGGDLHRRPGVIGDRAYLIDMAHAKYQSLSADAAASAPTSYSLTAPPEYFAECYVEYYREVDGSPGSLAKKGGGLPGPVKTWFDANVDKLKFDPERLHPRKSENISKKD